MKTTNLILLLQIAGVLHVGLLCAGALMPRVVNLKTHIANLPPFIRKLFWVYYVFIAFCLVAFGTITFIFADSLATGSPLSRALCVFFAVFWLIRLVAATFIFDVRPYLTNRLWQIGYQATNLVFVYLPLVYIWAAWKGGDV